MQIGEKAPAGVYDVTCLSKGTRGLVRFTDRGEVMDEGGNPDASLAKRRTALSAAFGAFLKQKGIPIAFEKRESGVSVLCRKCEGKIPMEITVSADKLAPYVAFDEGHSMPAETITRASGIAEEARSCLNTMLHKHGLYVANMTLRFGFAGEIVIASMLNFDCIELKYARGTFPGKMTDDKRLVQILSGETHARVAA